MWSRDIHGQPPRHVFSPCWRRSLARQDAVLAGFTTCESPKRRSTYSRSPGTLDLALLVAARRRSGQRKCERWSQNRLSHVDIAHRSPSLWPPCQTRYGSVVQAMVSAGSPTVPWVSRVPMLTSSHASLPGRLARGCQRYPAQCPSAGSMHREGTMLVDGA